MLTLKELRFRAMGRFVDEQRISFEELGNLVQVDGQNNNSGGSSGAGKSTIFNALEFLFGLNSLPNSVLQSRLTEEPITVEGFFELDGQPLTITRGKKLKIEFQGEVTTGSSKLTEEKLDQILAIPRNLFRPMLHKRQGEKGFFLNFTPKETNDFLTDSLGLSRFKKYIDSIDVKLLDLSKALNTSISSLESKQSALDTLESAKATLGDEPKAAVDRDVILRLKQQADFSRQTLLELTEKHRVELAKLIRPEMSIAPFDDSAIRTLDAEIARISAEIEAKEKEETKRLSSVQADIFNFKTQITELKSQVAIAVKVKEEAIKLGLEIKKIREHFCPTCEQAWHTDSAKNKEIELLERLEEFKTIILASQNHPTQIEAAEARLTTLALEGARKVSLDLIVKRSVLDTFLEEEKKNQNQHYQVQGESNKEKQYAFDRQLQELSRTQSAEISSVRERADSDRRTLERSVQELRTYEEQSKQYRARKATFETQENDLSGKLVRAKIEKGTLERQISVLEEVKKAIKGFLSVSFDDALEIIGENATRLARNIPNMSNSTIRLVGTRETKEGKIKEEVTAVLSLDGDESIDIRSLCGGERSAIDLAVDLSVIELIENKTNKGINLYILDEPFSGMDTTGVEMSLEILRNSCQNKIIIVVDHTSEVKQMVESKILVIRDGVTSKVVQN